MSLLVYYSSPSENTHRFVEKLAVSAQRISYKVQEAAKLIIEQPFVLLTPTYGGGYVNGAVPKPVIHFLNNSSNRHWLRAVMSSGNTNFGEAYCLAGKIISQKCKVPYLYGFELLGTPDDVLNVREGLKKFWLNYRQQALQEQA